MKLKGKSVKHLKFGVGKITNFDEKSVEVQFEGLTEKKSFQYPQGFERFLQIQDQDMASEIAEEITELKKAVEQERVDKELARQLEEAPLKAASEKGGRKSKVNKKNIVVKCNYCNEGDNMDCIQYARQNLSSVKAGLQMSPEEITADTLAVLSTRTKGVKEEGRVIFAIFMVKEPKEGEEAMEGYIQADDEYKIALSFEEARQIKFWEFYYNEKKPESIRMASGLHRNFTDMQCAQILKEIVELRDEETEKEYAQNFLNYYCGLRKIDVNAITKPEGGLVRLREMWEK